MADEDEDPRFSFSLPPIRLPPLFPDRLRITLPVPGFRGGRELSSGWAVVVVLGFDVLDAVLATAGAGPVHLVRTVGGTVIAMTVGSWLGLVYLWEPVAVLLGWTWLTAFPTLSVVLLWALYREHEGAEGPA